MRIAGPLVCAAFLQAVYATNSEVPLSQNNPEAISSQETLAEDVSATGQDQHPLSELRYYGQSPSVYPSPVARGKTGSRWTEAHLSASNVVKQMELNEKVNLTYGHTGPCTGNTGSVPRLDIPQLCLFDGPQGIRGQEDVSAFPGGLTLATTWDRDLMLKYGIALGEEFRGKGINIVLGPEVAPLGRTVTSGRLWESASSDPYLAGISVGQLTKGIVKKGVIATAKHWLLHEQQFRSQRNRVTGQGAYSSRIDDKSLHELYVWPFMDALREGAGAVMCSRQRANQSYACQNSKLMNGILKGELGFEGFVMSDWWGQDSGVASARAGLDLYMPDGGYWGPPDKAYGGQLGREEADGPMSGKPRLETAVSNGSVSTARLNDMVTRLLTPWFLQGQDRGYPKRAVFSYEEKHDPVHVRGDHAQLIRKVAADGTVLLKNEKNFLPLKKPNFLSVYGYDATVNSAPWKAPSFFGNLQYTGIFNGTAITGDGSASATPPYVISPFDAIQQRLIQDGGQLRWDFYSENPEPAYINSDACLVFINSLGSGRADRPGLSDTFSDTLVLNVATKCANTIVVIHTAGVHSVEKWIHHKNVVAVLFAGMPGQEAGHSIVDVLWGDVNPSGRLPFTVAKKATDYGPLLNPVTSDEPFMEIDMKEGVFIDYRRFDLENIEPLYPFGFGLSYTTFKYSNLKISKEKVTGKKEYPRAHIEIVQGGHPELWEPIVEVTCTVENTGKVDGAEVAQLYVGVPGDRQPVRQLRGFDKLGLKAGQSGQAKFILQRRDLSVWDVEKQQWQLQRGKYKLYLGPDSRSFPLTMTLVIA